MTENEAINTLWGQPYIVPAKEYDEAKNMAIKALEEIQQCRAIGTVEECSVAVERMKPRKVKEIHCDEYYCPACGSENNCKDAFTVGHKFCPNCGQALLSE